jgi:hypothetical protein
MKTPAAPAASASISTTESQKFAGTYYGAETMSIRRFTAREGKLYLGANTELSPGGDGEFAIAGGTRLHFTADGKLRVDPVPGAPEMLLRVEPLTLDATALSKYAGTYRSDEIGVSWRLVVREGKLMLMRPDSALNLKDDEQEIRPLLPNVFTAGGMVLRFEPDTSQFVLGVGRMRGMVFVRQPSATASPSK